ncbi:MAG: hypothetical protein ACREVA_10720 [Burkholderiales bacterium]
MKKIYIPHWATQVEVAAMLNNCQCGDFFAGRLCITEPACYF